MALFLCLDSSTPCGSVAVCQDDRVLAEITLDVSKKTHSDYLLRYSHFLLQETHNQLKDIDGLVVVSGPGSFTGLRVGLATVQGLALALKLPVYPVSSLEVVAFANGPSELPVVAVIDARKKEVYAGCYRWQNGLPRPQGVERVLSPDILVAQISEKTMFVGNGTAVYSNCFCSQENDMIQTCPDVNLVPKAGAAGVLVHRKGQEAQSVDPFHLHPVYIRPSDAELHAAAPVV
nr:tRNA (adenosine(37)-N6)-threonylcarbamoyltransferase complex dimerization subunit type 1 TsaB [uncultured Desulfuromonas sp.]